MSTASASPELLKQAVLELVGECREQLARGMVADVSQIERGVRAYCTAIAALPLGEGRTHAQDLETLMKLMTELSDEMVSARDAVRAQLEALGRLQKASNAYQKSDTIGVKKHKKNENQS